jgi:hypothetical protein
MNLSGKRVLFHLTSVGRSALGRLVPERAFFQALVLDADATGAWVYFPEEKSAARSEPVPAMLLKWEYISTAVLEFKSEKPSARRGMGFVQR